VSFKDRYDVVVIGGGPAGSTAASLVAQQGYSVLLLERDASSPFQVGESLMPGTYWTFKRLGMLERLEASSFPRKYSVQFFGASGRGSAPFYFHEFEPHASAVTWQVVRSEFDDMMMENARSKGAQVVEGAPVREVLFDGERAAGVRVMTPDGTEREVGARVVVDATGQSALIARRLGMKKLEPKLKKASVFTHFSGGRRDDGIDEGATLILHTRHKQSWFWYIPLPDDRVSVGVVGGLDYLLRGRDGDAEEIFAEEVALCEPMQQRLADAEQVMPVKVTQDFSYRADRIAGDGWVLVGDAFGFVDPIYSSGVYLALVSGEMAADAIVEGLANDDTGAAQLGKFEQQYLRGMEAVRRLVYAFYEDEFSFSEFLRRNPDCRRGIVDILSGNLQTEDVQRVLGPLSEMCEVPPQYGEQMETSET
jgi:flavin-dependent dehydrogenase